MYKTCTTCTYPVRQREAAILIDLLLCCCSLSLSLSISLSCLLCVIKWKARQVGEVDGGGELMPIRSERKKRNYSILFWAAASAGTRRMRNIWVIRGAWSVFLSHSVLTPTPLPSPPYSAAAAHLPVAVAILTAVISCGIRNFSCHTNVATNVQMQSRPPFPPSRVTLPKHTDTHTRTIDS